MGFSAYELGAWKIFFNNYGKFQSVIRITKAIEIQIFYVIILSNINT